MRTVPEYPDIELYLHALRPRIVGETLEKVRLGSPFFLRSVEPRPAAAEGRRLVELRRFGKRIVFCFESELFLVLHLMIAGRLRWKPVDGKAPAKIPGRVGLAALDFSSGTVIITEAGSKKRAALHVVDGEDALAEHDPGGVELFDLDVDGFAAALSVRNHTLKRALTDPHILSGIGNAYSDEILQRARLSPFKQTKNVSPEETERLFEACRTVLTEWRDRLIEQTGDGFPAKVTAFRPEMAVHGKYDEPCPDCGTLVQRIRYADNEANYCPECQTEGRLLADRGLSQLLKKDWPKTLDELERRKDSLRRGR